MARDPQGTLITRHAPIDRLFHWTTALAVLLLLGGLVRWMPLHGIAGVLLCIAVAFHLLRAAFGNTLRHVLIWPRHLREYAQGRRAAKYTLPQKLMHALLGFAVLVACLTGALLLVRMDTPLWQGNAYLMSVPAWDAVRTLHHAAAGCVLVSSLVHIVYYLLPARRAYLRAMINGQMTREDAAKFHDPARWSGQRKDDPRD